MQPRGSRAERTSLALADSAATESPGAAERQREKATASELTDTTRRLTNHLDSLVPEYKTDRAGATGFIGAESVLDAGLKLVTYKNVTPEMAFKMYSKMNDAIGIINGIKDKLS